MSRHPSLVRLFLIWWLCCSVATKFEFCNGNQKVACRGKEREALLNFKQGLLDSLGQLSSWDTNNGQDCCMWRGVGCHNITRHVVSLDVRNSTLSGNLSHSLMQLKQLQHLDLSLNYFGGQQIPKFFGLLTTLRYLNLSNAGFGGAIPPQLGNLSSLRVLALGGNNNNFSIIGIEWVFHLLSLEFLDMSDLNLSKVSSWLQITNMLPSLSELRLSGCSLNHQITTPLAPHVNFSSLATLDLSDNSLDSSALTWLPNLPALVSLDLSRNQFQGTISTNIGNLTSLEELYLSSNRLVGEIPKSLSNLCNLRVLHLASNSLSKGITEFLSHLSSCLMVGLEALVLSDNNLSGHLPNQLGDLEQLNHLDISDNSFTGVIPASMGSLSALRYLDLTSNRLSGTVPETLGRLSNLQVLWITNNSLEGTISQEHLKNLNSLRTLDMSSNPQLNLQVKNNNWVPPFQLEKIYMRFTRVGPQLPHWLQAQKTLVGMYLSNAGISCPLPSWISSLTQLNVLDLSNNKISGELPHLSSTVEHLDLSNNSIRGSISSLLCRRSTDEETSLSYLDLSRNLLSGELTQCWTSWKNLRYLRLSHNNFTGELPTSMGSLSLLGYLYLRESNLSGELSRSLQNLNMGLLVLEMSENKFSGSIPQWMGDRFVALRILALRSNKLAGNIPPHGLCALKNLKILDLGDNNLTNTIPNCLSNISAMARQQEGDYFYYLIFHDRLVRKISDTLTMVIKDQEYETNFEGRTLLDFSCNNLTGKISDDLINLHNLQTLNLSRNRLEGMIPKKIGNMKALESLDLSMNRLSGEIPQTMATLFFLSVLNLSYNNLSGKIPTGTQIQGFSPLSFVGNDGLHGPPLTNNSNGPNPHPPIGSIPRTNNSMEGDDGDEWIGTKWFYVGIPFGFAVGFWGVLIPLALNKALRFSYNRFCDNLAYKLFCRL